MCCCCPPAISALFCLWVQSGFSKGTVAGALTFFPPDPPLYKFERRNEKGELLTDGTDTDDNDEKSDENDPALTANRDDEIVNIEGPVAEGYEPAKGETREKMKSPAQQLTERAKDLRRRANQRNARDALDAKNKVKYTLVLDPRLSTPRFDGGTVEAVKIPSKKGVYIAAIVYKAPQEQPNDSMKTIIYSHGNATDIGAMFPLQSILAHSLDCNVISYDYSGYGESGGVPMESNTYTDIDAVYQYTLKNIAGDDPSRIVIYGQSVGSGPCCYLSAKNIELGGMILHSPFTSGMRVLTPSRALACLDIYPNIDRIRKVKCPVMVIHGRLDEEVDIQHGMAMHQAVPNHFKREPWWVPDRGHNDITEGPGKLSEYIHRLRDFMGSLEG